MKIVEIDGVKTEVYTKEELDQIKTESMESARKIEKDKLYSRIADAEKKLSETTEQLAKIQQEKEKIEKEKADELEKERKSKLSELELIKETFNKEVELVSKNLNELNEKNKALEDDIKKERLRAFKNEVIAKSGGELIVELVSGTTEEEILTSVEVAKKAFIAYKEKFAPKKAEDGDEPKTGGTPPKTPPPAPPAPHGSGNAPLTPEAIQNMTLEEYAKHRDALIKQTRL